MIINPEIFNDTFRCKKIVANWLMYKKHIPLFGLNNGYYYFARTYINMKVLNKLPWWIRLLNLF